MAVPEQSLAQIVANLPASEREKVLAGLDPEALQYDPQFWLRPSQLRPINEDGWQLAALVAGRGFGKSVDLATAIPTPSGWTRMGALMVGDEVFDESGGVCRVTAVYDHDRAEDGAWNVQFSDGTDVVADGSHLWVTWSRLARKRYMSANRGTAEFPEDWPTYEQPVYGRGRSLDPLGYDGPRIRTTSDIRRTLREATAGAPLNHCIPLAGALDTPDAVLPIDPWVLGYALGNGSRQGSLCAGSKDGDFDADHVEACVRSAGFEMSRRDLYDLGHSQIRPYGLVTLLRGLGVLDHRRIPAQYLRASISQRVALLRGLMDSDGTAGADGRVTFYNRSRELADGVLELVRSLASRPVLRVARSLRDGVDFGEIYTVSWRPTDINPFSLPRKAKTVTDAGPGTIKVRHRMIVAIDPVKDRPMRCITVDSPNSMYLCGEGMIPTHNTRTMTEWARHKAMSMPRSRGAFVARTAADARDVLVNGESGILAVSPPSDRPEYEPSKRLLTWPNGTTALLFTSEAPDQLRGPQFHWSLADELASWTHLPDDSGLNAWENLRLATRLGDLPQILAGTTPKRTPFMRQLLKAAEQEEHVLLIRGKTTDNAGNLSKAYLDTIYGLYEGTALAQQELEGVMLDDAEGALWTDELLDENRLDLLPSLRRPLVVVGVDPAVSEKGGGDTTGIVVAVTDGAVPELYKREAYVLEDLSIAASPSIWANVVVHAARRYQAPVVVETNQGGGLIRSTIQGVDPTVKVIDVHSRQGKNIRAEPVVLAYEQHRVHHVGYFADLETQMTTWLPSDTRSKSPDRLDALVHALTALLVKPPEGLSGGTIRAKSPTRLRPAATGAARRSPGRVLLPSGQQRLR